MALEAHVCIGWATTQIAVSCTAGSMNHHHNRGVVLSDPTIKLTTATHKQPNCAVWCHLFVAMMLQMRSIWQMIAHKHAMT
jgi:hypothetical protein